MMSIIYNLVGLPTLGWGYSFIMVTKHLSHGGDVINPVESHQTSTLCIFHWCDRALYVCAEEPSVRHYVLEFTSYFKCPCTRFNCITITLGEGKYRFDIVCSLCTSWIARIAYHKYIAHSQSIYVKGRWTATSELVARSFVPRLSPCAIILVRV